MKLHVYRCPVCGCEVITEQGALPELSEAAPMTVTITLQHRAPMDAACRWALEALADEQKRILSELVQRVRLPTLEP